MAFNKFTHYLIIIFALFCITFSLKYTHQDSEIKYCVYPAQGIPIDTKYWYKIIHQWHGDKMALAINQNTGAVELVKSTNSDYQLWRFTDAQKCINWYYISNKKTFGYKNGKFLQPIPNSNNLQMAQKYFLNQMQNQKWRLFYDTSNTWIKFQTNKYENRKKAITLINDGKLMNNFQLRQIGNWSGQNWKLIRMQKIEDYVIDVDKIGRH